MFGLYKTKFAISMSFIYAKVAVQTHTVFLYYILTEFCLAVPKFAFTWFVESHLCRAFCSTKF